MKPMIQAMHVSTLNQILGELKTKNHTYTSLAHALNRSKNYATRYLDMLVKAELVIKETTKADYRGKPMFLFIGVESKVPDRLIVDETLDRLPQNRPHDTGGKSWLGNPFREGVRA